MRVYNSSQNPTSSTNNRSISSCSYCSNANHKVTDCPHVKADWAMFQSLVLPCSDPNHWTNNPQQPESGQGWNNQEYRAIWYKAPHGWSQWYAECEKAHNKILAAEARRSGNSPKKAKSCGFCGDKGHNRRNCPQMTALNKRIIAANNHWRRRLYDTFVTSMGLGVGALIEVEEQTFMVNEKVVKSIGLVTSINWDELNMFCFADKANRRWSRALHFNIQAPLVIKAQVDGRDRNITFKANRNNIRLVRDINNKKLIDVMGGGYGSPEFNRVISPAETPLSETWLTEGQSAAVEYVTKRYSLAKLTEWNVLDVLEQYEIEHNL